MSYPVSDEFLTLLTQSHQATFAGAVYDAYGAVLLDTLPIIGGSVAVDRTAGVRRTCNIMLAITDDLASLLPSAGSRSPFDPYGNQIAVSRGLRLRDGTSELCPLGLFRIDESVLDDNADGRVLTVTGSDMSKAVADAKYTVIAGASGVYKISRGTNVYTAITNLITDRLPTAVTRVGDSTSYTTPTVLLDGNSNPWEAAQALAVAAGAEVFFDVDGNLVLQAEPDPAADPAEWIYAEGPDCVMTALNRDYTVADTYNGVVVTGENSQGDAPVVGSAFDNDPKSPTYWYGPFGQRPTTVSNPLALSSGQATSIAKSMMLSMVGLSEKVQVTIVPNPALDASDVAHITRVITDFDEDVLVESFSVPLDLGTAMTVVCRTRRVIT